MKTRLFIITLICMVLFAIPVSAASPRASATATLTISGTTAKCTAMVWAGTSDTIDITMRLYRGNTCLHTWTKSGAGGVNLGKTVTVTKGYTYTLTVDPIINGVSQPQASDSKYCG